MSLLFFQCSTSHLLQHKELTEFGFCVRFLRQKYHPVMIWSYGLRWTQYLFSSQAQVYAIVGIHELRVLRNSSWYSIYPELRMQVACHWEIVVFALLGHRKIFEGRKYIMKFILWSLLGSTLRRIKRYDWGYTEKVDIGLFQLCSAQQFSTQLDWQVDGKLRQKGNTKDMIFSIPVLISYISSIMTLNEGDVILTGIYSHQISFVQIAFRRKGKLSHGANALVKISKILWDSISNVHLWLLRWYLVKAQSPLYNKLWLKWVWDIAGTPSGVGPVKAGQKITAGITGLVEMSFDVKLRVSQSASRW